MKITITSIDTSDRMREDLGDIESLAASLNELGLIQPIVLNQHNKLVAGGRRLAAARLLQWTEIDYVLLETLDEPHRRELELEENIRRKDLTWQEHVTAVADIHRLKVKNNALDGKSWGFRQTGELLNMSLGNVSYCLQIADELKKPGSHTRISKNLTEAIRVLAKEKEDEAMALLSKRTMEAASIPIHLVKTDIEGVEILKAQPNIPSGTIPLNCMLYHGDCIDILNKQFDAESVDHVITDPPYGIDMDNLAQSNTGMVNIDTVSAEHDVENNLVLFTKMFSAVYRVMRPDRFFVFFYDLAHHEKLQAHATAAGFKVQRWPLVWVKTHPCLNQAAQWNFTKSCEYAMVCRKGNATLVIPQATSHFACSKADTDPLIDHPFAKPFNLWKWIFQAVALKGQTILDPFAGEGSCPITAINCLYVPIAIESNQTHFSKLVENVVRKYKMCSRDQPNFTLPDATTTV